ncbi:tetratricopeptide repeat protein [Chitinimonas sp. BJB300]|uniref:tetratricopeptide repeat protein n=1 Tax=Chitinimonas sp. BJB300 TaxID=1559339 RepID=UPI000C111BAC|nr:tetratricopeptide repeat protein [Chitinimonas sp. BJB300]PHV11068.1 hypothetical protein CSQ89_12845 [Chitinimonas sp. BJB300]TSJ91525.1 tetratricopeptide repeat protein [Chitinimonas sp. BJB300]
MSLLLDALKKAEEAKRLKQAAEQNGDSPPLSITAAPASEQATTADFPDLDLQPINEPEEAALPQIQAPEPIIVPTYTGLSLTEAELTPVEAETAPPLLQHVHVPEETLPPSSDLALSEPSLASPPSPPMPDIEPLASPEPIPVAGDAEAFVAAPLATNTAESKVEQPTTSQPSSQPVATNNPPPYKTNARPKRQSKLILIAGLLLLCFCAAVGWLWWLQQQPASGLLLAAPTETSEAPISSTDTAQIGAEVEVPAAQEPSSATPSEPPPTENPASPPASSKATASPATEPAKPRTRRAGTPSQHDRASIIEPTPPKEGQQDVRFIRNQPQAGVAVLVNQAYQTFEQGDFTKAGELYRQQLGLEPKNRDALLGLAAVALKQGRLGEARAAYQRLLSDNPRDALAQAALTSLAQDNDAENSESRLKNLYTERPSADVAAALGSLLAKQNRWREAQDYYFKAHTADPDQPDHAFNLAVSLDALGERPLARTYYQRALDLAQKKPASFDPIAAIQRLNSLSSP